MNKVYFHHLKKCGGTSLNRWLDSQFETYDDNFRSLQLEAYRAFGDEKFPFVRERKRMQKFAESILEARDLLYDHSSLACLVPEGTFRFTVLRNPVDRLVSQVRDYKAMEPHQYAHLQPKEREVHSDACSLPLADYLKKHGKNQAPRRDLFDNYLVRAISRNRAGHLCGDFHNASAFLQIAIESLEKDFEFVGVLEEDQVTRKILAAMVGWVPSDDLAILNKSATKRAGAEELDDAKEIIAELTECDERLYVHAQKLFEATKQQYAKYDRRRFKQDFADEKVSSIKSVPYGSGKIFHLNQPILATGHLGRDTDNTGHSWLWTSPEQLFTLYLPSTPDVEITTFLRIGGYRDPKSRNAMKVTVCGKPVEYSITRAKNGGDILQVRHKPSRKFHSIEVANQGGLRIDAYGWEPVPNS